jgi:hypothetical protein|tara:strand:- start:2130 stop:2333 length:204 start_codon:yes stop_codon:yes gene_type:complete
MNIEQEAKKYRQDVEKEFIKELNTAFAETERYILKSLHNSDERESSLRRLEEAKSWCVLCKDRHGVR